jgi:hypothetical protein
LLVQTKTFYRETLLRIAPWLAISIGAACILMGIFTYPFALLNNRPTTAYSDPSPILAVSFGIVGALIASRNPRHRIGWIYLTIAFCYGMVGFFAQYAVYTLIVRPGALPFGGAASIFGQTFWGPGLTLILTYALLLFPTGHVPSRGWRIASWLSVVPLLSFVLMTVWFWQFRGRAFFENPDRFSPTSNQWFLSVIYAATFPFLLFCGLLGVLSLIYRYRHSDLSERLQLKWFVYASVMFFIALLANQELSNIYKESHWPDYLMLPLVPAIPVAAGIAILRYHLFDIDVIIRRTLLYAVLTTTLAIVYFGGVIVMQSLLRLATGATSPLVLVISTLVIAALFSPLRRRLQERIDFRFYRRKYDSVHAVEAFANTLRDEVDLERMTGDLMQVVDNTVQPESVSLWIRPASNKTS